MRTDENEKCARNGAKESRVYLCLRARIVNKKGKEIEWCILSAVIIMDEKKNVKSKKGMKHTTALERLERIAKNWPTLYLVFPLYLTLPGFGC